MWWPSDGEPSPALRRETEPPTKPWGGRRAERSSGIPRVAASDLEDGGERLSEWRTVAQPPLQGAEAQKNQNRYTLNGYGRIPAVQRLGDPQNRPLKKWHQSVGKSSQ